MPFTHQPLRQRLIFTAVPHEDDFDGFYSFPFLFRGFRRLLENLGRFQKSRSISVQEKSNLLKFRITAILRDIHMKRHSALAQEENDISHEERQNATACEPRLESTR